MIKRTAAKIVIELAAGYPIVAITGPRQSGKTTLARALFDQKPYVSLEDPDQRELAATDPRGFLALYPDGAVIDEAQRCPDLFSYLQTRVDLDGRSGQFVLTGSQQFGLLSGITQSLAGRVGLVELLPFSLGELKAAKVVPGSLEETLFRGAYPPIHARSLAPGVWYANYVRTYVERDVRQLINVRDLTTFQRFVRMCAARTGMLLNLSSLANDCGITHNTAKAWLSILEASYIAFLLPPHHRNFNKRLVKSPKLYFHDTGLAAWLLGIAESSALAIHPMRGPLFENWVIAELLKGRFNRGLPSNLFFWRDSTGNEIDVLAETGGGLTPLEIKSGQTVTRDFLTGLERWRALADGATNRSYLAYGGDTPQSQGAVEVIPWRDVDRVGESI